MRASLSPLPPAPKPDSRPIRVMLVDDSNVVRSIFARMLSGNDEIEIVGEAANSAEALCLLEQFKVDIILLDIEMPERSGLDALPEILAAGNGARVLVVSSFAEENGPAAIRALELGACDTLAKPGRFGFAGKFPDMLVEKVVRLGNSTRRFVKTQISEIGELGGANLEGEISTPECIAIGSSTGGIPIIYEIIRNLPENLDCPIFIAQHLPDTFMEFFARQLSSQTNRRVCVPETEETIRERTIYVSPGNVHLTCVEAGGLRKIRHLEHYSASRYSPSVDALFASVAEVYGSGALALVLSGMGNDGAAGARELSSNGAHIVVQDEDSSVVWGMPGAVAKAGLANAIMTPAKINGLLAQVARR